MTILDEIEEYRRRVLVAHWAAFSCISHAPTKGRMRERVISNLLNEEYGISTVSGIACDENGIWQSPEIDIICLRNNTRRGTPGIYHLEEIFAECEVKSKAASNDFQSTENAAAKIKEHSSGAIITTMFCFATHAKRKTVCGYFGFQYDTGIKAFNSYDSAKDSCTHIDHFLSLDASNSEQPFLITKDTSGHRNLMIGERPIERFFKLFQPL